MGWTRLSKGFREMKNRKIAKRDERREKFYSENSELNTFVRKREELTSKQEDIERRREDKGKKID